MGRLDDPAHLDYVALSAHKMYAPFGTGALIARRDTLQQGEPEYRGGGTIEFVTLDAVAWSDKALTVNSPEHLRGGLVFKVFTSVRFTP